MAENINWISTPVIGSGILSAANNTYDGSGTIVTIVPAVSALTLAWAWEAIATGATSASGGHLIFVRVSAGGTRFVVDSELIPPSITPSGTQLPARLGRIRPELNPLVLDVGDSLAAYETVANPFHIRVYGGRP